ncbi:hypothetical protein ACIHCQ_35775 [Streptomyces sp. NPDC052236]|uniref:hypothetical protein n=1 Tax=Streptomyces sp. NPDC052236 TaxID=3365686 RepID=UPI0037D58BB7
MSSARSRVRSTIEGIDADDDGSPSVNCVTSGASEYADVIHPSGSAALSHGR